jgi:Ca-activated chloride channel family protein
MSSTSGHGAMSEQSLAIPHFDAPGWLFSLVGVFALLVGYLILQRRRKVYVARFSNVALLQTVVPRRPGWRRHLTFALLFTALLVLSIGVARPTGDVRVPRERATVMIALDVSLSMEATDVLPTRIEAAKKAAKQFVDLLPTRINVGLVSFSGTASVETPPTIDRDAVKLAIDNLKLGESTAIGEAIFASIAAIQAFTKSNTPKDDSPAPARIVLLSDGYSNSGRDPDKAITAALTAKIPVSTIAFGTQDGQVTLQGRTVAVPADRDTLQAIASQTGGSFHTATSAGELRDVYKDIGSQIGYTTAKQDISWRFLMVGLLLGLAAAFTSLLWAGRLM